MSSTAKQMVPLVGGIGGGVLLFVLLSVWNADFDPNAVGLGANTSVRIPHFGGGVIGGRGGDLDEVVHTAKAFKAAGHDIVLWLGASQTHAINNQSTVDRLAVTWANRASQERGSRTRYVLLSEPNGNLHELWALLINFAQRIEPSAVVLAFTYDDLREPGVRPSLRALYATAPIDMSLVGAAKEEAPAEVAGERTPQQRLEGLLTATLTSRSDAYARRDKTRSALYAMFKLGFARTALRFLKRPQERIPPARSRWNMDAFARIVAHVDQQHVPLLVYKAPHRPGMQPFYHPRAAYDAFFERLSIALESNHTVELADFETLIPADEWGMTNAGQPDVFHFTGSGHRALGRAVDSRLAESGF